MPIVWSPEGTATGNDMNADSSRTGIPKILQQPIQCVLPAGWFKVDPLLPQEYTGYADIPEMLQRIPIVLHQPIHRNDVITHLSTLGLLA
jgi:hypothetical protein